MPVKYNIEWTFSARNDLEEIVDFVSLDSTNNAIMLYEALVQKAESLINYPKRGRIIPELRRFGIDSYREIFHGPFRIFYKIKPDSTILIFGIIDGRRDLEQIVLNRITDL